MLRRKKSDASPEAQSVAEPKIPKELLDQLITGPITQGEFESIFRALEAFASSRWGEKYPTIAQFWRRAWENVILFFAFLPEVRRVIYTTNVIESLHMQLREFIKNRGHFPNDDAAIKLIRLALRNIIDGKVRSAREWKLAMNQFAVLYGDRFTNTAS